jgi:hypothetical protein
MKKYGLIIAIITLFTISVLTIYFVSRFPPDVAKALGAPTTLLTIIQNNNSSVVPPRWISVSSSTSTYPYSLIGGLVYFDEWGGQINGADANTFSVLVDPRYSVHPYAKDANGIYCDDQFLPLANIDSFLLISSLYSKLDGAYIIRYARDNQNVYFNCMAIGGADPYTFRPLLTSSGDPTAFSLDKDTVFYGDAPIPGADRATFRLIENGSGITCAGDQDHVYYVQAGSLQIASSTSLCPTD